MGIKKNYINFKESDENKSIYRVFKRQRFFELFKQQKLTLVKPKNWKDPFENYIMNATGELDTGEKFSIAFRDNFFGQCWTQKKESDALWRIYAPDEDGIKVKTTLKKLYKALYDSGNQFRDISCFIGKIKYDTTANLTKNLGDANFMRGLLLDQTGYGQAYTLCFKRKQFDYEKEVRLIYNSQGKIKRNIYKFKIDPFDLFDEIVFDPRMDFKDYRRDKSELVKLGFKNSIIKSTLYKIPQLKIKF